VEVSPDQILVTSGTSPAMLLLFMSLLEPGEEVILPNALYACYPNFVCMVKAVPVFLNVYEEERIPVPSRGDQDSHPPAHQKSIFVIRGQSHGELDAAGPDEGHRRIGKTVVSDEISTALVYEGKEQLDPGVHPRRDGHQRVLQVICHDRLAAWGT